MSRVSIDKLVSSSLLAFSLFLAVLASCFFFFLSLHKITSIKETYKVDELIFLRAVDSAVSNYFDRVLADRLPAISSPSLSPPENVCFVNVEGLGTYYTPRRGWRCVIGDNSFGIGDFCEHGLIQGIVDGRVYCLLDSKRLILRRGSVGAPTVKQSAPPERAEGSAL